MPAQKAAFPVLVRCGQAAGASLPALTTQLMEVCRASLPRVQELLRRSSSRLCPITDEGLQCEALVGAEISIPLTVVGSLIASRGSTESSTLLLHSPGLPGAFQATAEELYAARCRIACPEPRHKVGASTPDVGTLCLMEAINQHFTIERGRLPILDRFYSIARRRCFSLRGMEHLIASGQQLHLDALQLTFPYHCGGAQAVKQYLDITPEVADVFGPHRRHGTKILTRYGTAVGVGATRGGGSTALETPSWMWHPSGATAACLAPLLDGCRRLPVGTIPLDYNGPTPTSAILQGEDPRRYMNVTMEERYDTTLWLTKGLFGVQPGDVWRRPGDASSPPFRVVGVGYQPATAELELFVRNTQNGDIIPADDL